MKILVADDHPVFRKGLVELISDNFREAEIEEAENGRIAVNKARIFRPDIAILDIEMPEKDGLQVCLELKELFSNIKLIILTMYDNSEVFNMAMNHYVDGFLLKDDSTKEIVNCIQAVLSNEPQYISHRMNFHKNPFGEKLENQKRFETGLKQLTDTEKKVLLLVTKNCSSKEIALRLFITPKSVENYRSRICKKLNLESKSHSLTTWVLENNKLIRFFLTPD